MKAILDYDLGNHSLSISLQQIDEPTAKTLSKIVPGDTIQLDVEGDNFIDIVNQLIAQGHLLKGINRA